jgi:hypothetical protein
MSALATVGPKKAACREGHERHFASQKNSERFRHRTIRESVTELLIGMADARRMVAYAGAQEWLPGQKVLAINSSGSIGRSFLTMLLLR